ncbi:MAG: glycosyltransferase [Gammaproteobacteria bacterium]|nr:glycosyltransferase [Gammaproteobacteria bacterium]
MTNNKKHAVIVAGGTGGHIYPALAFAKRWQTLGHAISWIGTKQGLEASIVPKQNIPLFFITVKGVRRSKILAQVCAFGMALYAICQAMRLLRRLKPDVVLGMGGYVSGPSILAARCLNIPVVIHEQNAVAGKTNQLVARFSQKILTAFPNVLTRYKPIVTGNPVRAELTALMPKSHPHQPMRVLILGGSRGASRLK